VNAANWAGGLKADKKYGCLMSPWVFHYGRSDCDGRHSRRGPHLHRRCYRCGREETKWTTPPED
jgi:hypothetical protein